MIVIFGLEPKSVVVAHMLEKLRGMKAVLFDSERKFFFDQVEDARTADFGDIYEEYREKYGKIDFLEDPKLYDVISGDIFWALRFGAIDRSALVLQMLDKIGATGSKAYLAEETPESKEMRFRVRRVLAEFNRARKYIKFDRFEDVKLSLGSATFESDIADMVLRTELTRCPEGYCAAVQGEKTVNIMINGMPYLAKSQKIPLSSDRKGFKHFWGGLPESAGDAIWADEMHRINEFPRMQLQKERDAPEKVLDRQISTLDDFVA
jgi:hypothetical protein